jgi:hypothetical protein
VPATEIATAAAAAARPKTPTKPTSTEARWPMPFATTRNGRISYTIVGLHRPRCPTSAAA